MTKTNTINYNCLRVSPLLIGASLSFAALRSAVFSFIIAKSKKNKNLAISLSLWLIYKFFRYSLLWSLLVPFSLCLVCWPKRFRFFFFFLFLFSLHIFIVFAKRTETALTGTSSFYIIFVSETRINSILFFLFNFSLLLLIWSYLLWPLRSFLINFGFAMEFVITWFCC